MGNDVLMNKEIRKILAAEAKARAKEEAAILKASKPKKEKPPKKPKEERTEAQLVEQYANTIIAKTKTRGTVDKKHGDIQNKSTPSTKVVMDSDFYFSIVFKTQRQKYEFLEQLQQKFDFYGADDGVSRIQILNGVILADLMGFDIAKENVNDYPTLDIELKDLILNN